MGSATGSWLPERVHVLASIGLSLEIDGSLLLTLGKLNNDENIKRAGEFTIEVVQAEMKRTRR